jgi:hypothetical protein
MYRSLSKINCAVLGHDFNHVSKWVQADVSFNVFRLFFCPWLLISLLMFQWSHRPDNLYKSLWQRAAAPPKRPTLGRDLLQGPGVDPFWKGVKFWSVDPKKQPMGQSNGWNSNHRARPQTTSRSLKKLVDSTGELRIFDPSRIWRTIANTGTYASKNANAWCFSLFPGISPKRG